MTLQAVATRTSGASSARACATPLVSPATKSLAAEWGVATEKRTVEQIAVDLQQASDIQNVERVRALSEEYAHTQELLEDMMTRWGELAEGVEQPAANPK